VDVTSDEIRGSRLSEPIVDDERRTKRQQEGEANRYESIDDQFVERREKKVFCIANILQEPRIL
jgi:hypothetical protein